MKVYLPEHVIPRLQVLFHGVKPLRLDIDPVGLLIDVERVEDPFQVIDAILCAGHKAVAQQVIHPVAIELRRHELRDERGRVIVPVKRGECARKRGVEAAQHAVDLGRLVEHDAARPVFVMKVKDLLDDVRERAVSEVVKQRARSPDHARLVAHAVSRAEQVERARHQVHHPYRMSEAAVLRALVCEHRQSQLLYAPEPLELCRIDQVDYQPVVGDCLVQRDDVMQRIAVISLRQFRPLRKMIFSPTAVDISTVVGERADSIRAQDLFSTPRGNRSCGKPVIENIKSIEKCHILRFSLLLSIAAGPFDQNRCRNLTND